MSPGLRSCRGHSQETLEAFLPSVSLSLLSHKDIVAEGLRQLLGEEKYRQDLTVPPGYCTGERQRGRPRAGVAEPWLKTNGLSLPRPRLPAVCQQFWCCASREDPGPLPTIPPQVPSPGPGRISAHYPRPRPKVREEGGRASPAFRDRDRGPEPQPTLSPGWCWCCGNAGTSAEMAGCCWARAHCGSGTWA